MKKKLSKAELRHRSIKRSLDELHDDVADFRAILVDIAYLLAPIMYDVRTRGKFRLKSVRRVADLIRNNERSDMTKLEQAFWTGEEVE